MGKFSTGLLAGTMLGIGMMVTDKRTVKRARKLLRRIPGAGAWL